jgi:Na+-transporting methylmalonyl-CoA/oxaloacetate decarboxylase gamma subunit
MDTFTFGLTLTVVGMGGTLLSLWLLGLVAAALKKVFPFTKESDQKEGR